MLSGRGLCDELITRPEESYRLCCVVVCDIETPRMGAPYIYDISRLRVKIVSNWQSLLPIYIFLYLFYTAFRKKKSLGKQHWPRCCTRYIGVKNTSSQFSLTTCNPVDLLPCPRNLASLYISLSLNTAHKRIAGNRGIRLFLDIG